MAAPGDILPITMKLADGNNSVFVKASVRNDMGSHLPGSPVSLPNVGIGRYSSAAFTMPEIANFVTADYQVYQDAGFTIPAGYDDGADVFPLSASASGGGGGTTTILVESIVGELVSSVSCGSRHSCSSTKKVNVIQSADTTIIVRVVSKVTGRPLDLTPYLLAAGGELHANFVKADDTQLQLSLASGKVTCTDPKIGEMLLTIDQADSDPSILGQGDGKSFELELIKHFDASNETLSVVQFLYALNVKPRIENLCTD